MDAFISLAQGHDKEAAEVLVSLSPELSLAEAQQRLRQADFLWIYQGQLRRVERLARENVGKSFEGVAHIWKRYEGTQGARALVADLSGKGTGWCIAGV